MSRLSILTGLCKVDADARKRGEHWVFTAYLTDDATLTLTGNGDTIVEDHTTPTVRAWDAEFTVTAGEALALMSGAVPVERWLRDIDDAARMLAEAAAFRDELDGEVA